MSRWISSIKSGEYKSVMVLPVGRSELGKGGGGESGSGKGMGYPGPRPPLKTRRFEKSVVV